MASADGLFRAPRSLQNPRLLFWSFVAVVLGATLYPFQFAMPANLLPDYHKNPVWEPPDGMIFHGVGMFSFRAPSPDVVERIQEAGAFYIYLEALPTVGNQYGPSRLFALSRSKLSHAFLIGQHGRDLVFRVRQQPPSSPERGIFQAVFSGACEARVWQAFLVTADAGRIRAYRDGQLIGEHTFENQPPAHWNPDNYLVAGNEATGNRAWRGRLRRVEFGAGRPPKRILEEAGVPEELAPEIGRESTAPPLFDLAAREGRLPEGWSGHRTDVHGRPPPRPWSLVPFRNTPYVAHPFQDILVNFLLFVPIGWLWIRQGGKLATAVGLGTLLSVGIETAQVFLPARTCDATDVVLNCAGAAAGAAAAVLAARRAAQRAATPH